MDCEYPLDSKKCKCLQKYCAKYTKKQVEFCKEVQKNRNKSKKQRCLLKYVKKIKEKIQCMLYNNSISESDSNTLEMSINRQYEAIYISTIPHHRYIDFGSDYNYI